MNNQLVRISSLALVCAATFLACAEADDGNPIVTADAAPTTDAAVPDVGNDAAKDSAVTVEDSAPACAVGATDSRACGACGTQTRFCMPNSQWTSWTACSGEKDSPECLIGEKRENDCGNCGKQTDTCDTKTCTWTSGFCAGEGECAPGETEKTSASCGDPSLKRTRTCGDKCTWSAFTSCEAPTGWLPMEAAPISGRNFHSAVWTGSRMLVWGGASSSSTMKNDGASYDLSANKWTTIAASPLSARRQHASIWTGSKLFVFGGYDTSTPNKTGALYDPVDNTWMTIPDAPISARHSSAIGYSAATNEVLVWGGCTSGYCTAAAADGAAYDLATNTWKLLPPSPLAGRTDMAYGMLNGELVIWGGRSNTSTMLVDGARFDPVARTWVKYSSPASTVLDGRYDAAVLMTSNALVVWGGRSTDSASSAKSTGALYQPMVGWTALPTPESIFSPSPKRFDVAAWSGKGKLWFYSGIPSTAFDLPYTGFVSYELATGLWKDEDSTGITGYRARASAVWTGKEVIVWGGANGNISGTFYNTGAIHRP